MQLSKNSPSGEGNRRLSAESGRKMVGVLGVEPRTSSLSGTRSNQLSYTPNGEGLVAIAGRLSEVGGARRVRTVDLLNANQALYQLSYGPALWSSWFR